MLRAYITYSAIGRKFLISTLMVALWSKTERKKNEIVITREFRNWIGSTWAHSEHHTKALLNLLISFSFFFWCSLLHINLGKSLLGPVIPVHFLFFFWKTPHIFTSLQYKEECEFVCNEIWLNYAACRTWLYIYENVLTTDSVIILFGILLLLLF